MSRRPGRGRAGRAWIGISGYSYPRWRGDFYPAELPARLWLEHASRAFRSIELNGTFYSLKTPSAYRRWAEATPRRAFVFAVKGSRFITHNLKLTRPEPALANFFASGVLALGRKTGPFLWQLPEALRYDADRVERFLQALPRTSAEAAELARGAPGPLRGGALFEPQARVRYRHAFEVRHPSWITDAFARQLEAHRCALVIADTAGRWPHAEWVTADFVYVRLHGSRELYASGYDDGELETWASRVAGWAGGSRLGSPHGDPPRDVYVYFDNDARGHAPHDALQLAERVRARGVNA